MMGRTHAATGVLAGLLVGPWVGLADLPQLAPFAVATAGYALLPDLDHPSSTATRQFGLVSRGLSLLLRGMSAWLYARTKGPRDEPGGTHRHLTHTFIFAAVLGGLCTLATGWGGPWGVAGWLVVGVALAVDRLGWPALVGIALGAAAWLPALPGGLANLGPAVLATLDATCGWLGIAVALGCAVHCLGDAVTVSGCPFLWPFLRIRGETWYEIRPPRWLRFRTGSWIENGLVLPLVVLGCVAAIPGLLPYVIGVLTAAPEVTAPLTSSR
jgi:membrane-bound metal-dependent hydrolase YbcI (DUF457 family)